MSRVRYYPLDPRAMANICRRLARDLRNEYAAGDPPISLSSSPWDGQEPETVSRLDAADSLDEQADRWAEEARTGRRNEIDRARMGM